MSSGAHTAEDFKEEMNDLILGLKKETACRDVYRQVAEQVTDTRVKVLYRWFVSAADARIKGLQAVQTTAAATQEWAEGIDEQIKKADAQAGEAPQFDPAVDGKPGRSEVTTLRQAIELEKETASIYFTAIQRSRDPNIRAFYRYLASVEGRHKQILENCFDGCMKQALRSL